MKSSHIKKLTTIGMLSALAYLVMFFIKVPMIPAAPYLKYEPKDVIILISGFIFGPASVIFISVVVSFLELITISTTGLIGFTLNVVSSISFSLFPAYLYKKNRSFSSVTLGLFIGSIIMLITMLLWNYIFTPIFLNTPRENIIPLLVSAILPFNLIKSAVNSALILILYKPVVNTLRRTNIIEMPSPNPKAHNYLQHITIAFFILLTAVLLILVFNHII